MCENPCYHPSRPVPQERAAYAFGVHFVQLHAAVVKSWRLAKHLPEPVPDRRSIDDLINKLKRLTVELQNWLPVDQQARGEELLDSLNLAWRSSRIAIEMAVSIKTNFEATPEINGFFERECLQNDPTRLAEWQTLVSRALEFCSRLLPPLGERMAYGIALTERVLSVRVACCPEMGRTILNCLRDFSWLERQGRAIWDAYDGLGFLDSDNLVPPVSCGDTDLDRGTVEWAVEIHRRLCELYAIPELAEALIGHAPADRVETDIESARTAESSSGKSAENASDKAPEELRGCTDQQLGNKPGDQLTESAAMPDVRWDAKQLRVRYGNDEFNYADCPESIVALTRMSEAKFRRDAFIYTRLQMNANRSEIRKGIQAEPGWDRIASDTGVRNAAKTFADKFHLPQPPRKNSGRPKGSKTKNRSGHKVQRRKRLSSQ